MQYSIELKGTGKSEIMVATLEEAKEILKKYFDASVFEIVKR